MATNTGRTAGESHEPQSNVFAAATNRMTTSTVAYDAAGNQTLYSPHTLAYDAENRLKSMTHASSGSGTHLYDAEGRRVKKTWTAGGGTAQDTYYVYDIAGNLAAEYGTASNPDATPPAPPATLYPFTDMLGSVRAVTDAAGTVVEYYDYLPFGRMLSSSDLGAIETDPGSQEERRLRTARQQLLFSKGTPNRARRGGRRQNRNPCVVADRVRPPERHGRRLQEGRTAAAWISGRRGLRIPFRTR